MHDSARAAGGNKAKREDAWHWLLGGAITVFAVGSVALALMAMPRAVEANRRACLAARANDLHADLAAFGEDPAWQSPYVDALAACAN
jgi:hypothetical protein